MKKFKFRLEKVLGFKGVLKKESELELARRNSDLANAHEKLENIMSEQDATEGFPNKILPMTELILNKDYHQALQEALERQRLIVIEVAKTVEVARDMYLERLKEEEVLKKLREKRNDEHLTQEKREENKLLKNYVAQKYKQFK